MGQNLHLKRQRQGQGGGEEGAAGERRQGARKAAKSEGVEGAKAEKAKSRKPERGTKKDGRAKRQQQRAGAEPCSTQ